MPIRVRHLAPSEHDRELHLVAFAQEPTHVLHLRDEVVLVDLGPELHLLDDDVRSCASMAATLFLLVRTGRSHDPARTGGLALAPLRPGRALLSWAVVPRVAPQLLAVGPDEEDLAGSVGR
jgi:hypothetical protein